MTENKSEYNMAEITTPHKDGVYLRYRDGHEEWFDGKNKKVNVRGIAIHLGERYTCVSLFDVEDFYEGITNFPLLEYYNNDTEEDKYTFIREFPDAYSDMDGEKHTKSLMRRGCKIPIAEDTYIPSVGEWLLVLMFFSRIQTALIYANGTTLKDAWYWLSSGVSGRKSLMANGIKCFLTSDFKFGNWRIRPFLK